MNLPGALSSYFTEKIWFHSNSTDRYLYLLHVCDRIIIPLPTQCCFSYSRLAKSGTDSSITQSMIYCTE